MIDPTDPTDPTDPIDPTDPTDPIDPTDPTVWLTGDWWAARSLVQQASSLGLSSAREHHLKGLLLSNLYSSFTDQSLGGTEQVLLLGNNPTSCSESVLLN